MITVGEALGQILQTINPLGLEKINFLDSLGRVIGEDVAAGRNIPPKDNSAMDGYALRWRDTVGASMEHPVILEVIEDIPAGAVPKKIIAAGQAARIMTGAPIPEGADAVLRMEDTEKDGTLVKIKAEAQCKQDIRLAGEDVREGEVVIPWGSIVRPAEIGMLASLGRSFISVYQKPLVAVLATGNELVDIDENPSPWAIVNSNSYSIAAQVMDCGATTMQMGIAKDERNDLVAKFQAALRADVIISSGGVSVGDYDLVKDIMKEVGSRMQFWQVAMRPGKPLAYGTIGNVPLFGLPGNPVSSMISFEEFIRPAILKMMGHKKIFRKTVKAFLKEDIKKRKGFMHFIRAVVAVSDGRYVASTTGEQGSGILKSMVRANGLIILPEEKEFAKAGDEVTVQLIDDSLKLTAKPEYL
ncbi:MAG: molybdopterin molybdotransferase MoeA [Syntrophales bacterium]|nr:molybdopterin molybdotransferase MoeA [Syntrophales bacterium]